MKSKIISFAFLALSLVSLDANGKTPYINKVYDYVPAPGQFINVIPEYEAGDTKESMIKKVQDAISGDAKELISLGGYGGYVVFGFDHTIINVANTNDFKVWGNAFVGSSEPGIIMVSRDDNGDGLPNDKWYLIGGSEYNNSTTIKNYQITYVKPTNSLSNISWTSNTSESGAIERNIYHDQPYYPQWISDETIKFQGMKLPNNAVIKNGLYYFNSYAWGYADNWANTDVNSEIDIEWALDDEGYPANLSGIDFVKVYTGVNQSCGDVGETSTEVCGAEDLHLNAGVNNIIANAEDIYIVNNLTDSYLLVKNSGEMANGRIFSVSGSLISNITIEVGESSIDVSQYPSGVYIMQVKDKILKFIKK